MLKTSEKFVSLWRWHNNFNTWLNQNLNVNALFVYSLRSAVVHKFQLNVVINLS